MNGNNNFIPNQMGAGQFEEEDLNNPEGEVDQEQQNNGQDNNADSAQAHQDQGEDEDNNEFDQQD